MSTENPIEEFDVPDMSMLFAEQYDYIDCYSTIIKNNKQPITAKEIALAFFSSAPPWVETLFSFRNKIARTIGLKIPKEKGIKSIDKIQVEKGSTIGLFKIFEVRPDEVIMGENDKHLDFRVSLLQSPVNQADGYQRLYITTVVKFNNKLGKCYFLLVKPFHKTIVPAMLRTMARKLENL